MTIFKAGNTSRSWEAQRDLDKLIELLASSDRDLQYEVVEAITRLGDQRGIEAPMALVADPATDELIRAGAWLALDVGWEREAKKRTSWS